jgi:citrate lyase subunit beta/citryl-CoA lyase
MPLRPRRSALYMPAANVRAIEKSRELPCDVVILDLEDGVAPDAKGFARARAVEAVVSGGFGRREVVVRVNAIATPWGQDDLAAACRAGPDAILAPKVSSARDVAAYAAAMTPEIELWAMIETCAAIFSLKEIAAAGPSANLGVWVIGSNDLAKEMRCRPDENRLALSPLLSLAVACAHGNGLTILDGVYNELDDDAGLERQCRQGADIGFDGKTLIHPLQISRANHAFSPSAEEVTWSQTIVDAFGSPEAALKGVLRVEGKMVERLHLEEARRVLAVAAATQD